MAAGDAAPVFSFISDRSGARAGDGAQGAPQVERVDTADDHSRVSHLLRRRYAWRGYGEVTMPVPQRHAARCTLAARIGALVVGTLSVAWDRTEAAEPGPLGCDTLFASELDTLRATGLRLCEFSRLAVDTARPGIAAQLEAAHPPTSAPVRDGEGAVAAPGRSSPSEAVLTALFHAAYAIGRLEGGCDMLVAEVNPRHVGHYRRQYGAQVVAGPRHHPQVGAPSVLLQMSMARLDVLAKRAERQGRVPPAGRYTTVTFGPLGGDVLSGAAAAAPARSAPEWHS